MKPKTGKQDVSIFRDGLNAFIKQRAGNPALVHAISTGYSSLSCSPAELNCASPDAANLQGISSRAKPNPSKRLTLLRVQQNLSTLFSVKTVLNNWGKFNVSAKFLSRLPCVIVDPQKIWRSELNCYPEKTANFPIELDLAELNEIVRPQVLNNFLRADPSFIEQQKDIRIWRNNLSELKSNWLNDVEKIIAQGIASEYLEKDSNGKFILRPENKELFLCSLDFRHADEMEVNLLVNKLVEYRVNGNIPPLTAIRLSSLCFLHTYIEVDPSNRIKTSGSDIVDFFHISLLPYCKILTVDGNMKKVLGKMGEEITLSGCKVVSKEELLGSLQEI